jgi:hypothetical protein
LVLPFALASTEPTRHTSRAILACGAMALAILMLVGINNKMPPMRTYLPLLSFPLGATLLVGVPSAVASRREREAVSEPSGTPESVLRSLLIGGALKRAWSDWKARPRLTQVVLVLLVIGTTMGVYRQCRRSMRVTRDRAALAAFVAEARSRPYVLHVCWEAALPFEHVSPLDNLRSWSGASILNLTWTQRTPWQESVKHRFGIANLAEALCNRDDIRLVANQNHRELFVVYAREHFQADLEYSTSSTFGEKLAEGRFHRVKAGDVAKRSNASATR